MSTLLGAAADSERQPACRDSLLYSNLIDAERADPTSTAAAESAAAADFKMLPPSPSRRCSSVAFIRILRIANAVANYCSQSM